MKFFLLLLTALTLQFTTFEAKAQSKFPIAGTFKVEQSNTTVLFNKVVIGQQLFTLFADANELEAYKIVSLTNGVYEVIQYFGEGVKKDARKLFITVNELDANRIRLTIQNKGVTEYYTLKRVN